jgi:Zn-dependent peptidase ImmA (M78 family)
MTTVAVNKEVLCWAMGRSGLTVEDLQNKFPKIEQWTSGKSQPTLRQLESLAKVTSTPLGFFFLKSPPEERLPVPHFRTLGDEDVHKPSPELLETVHLMQQRQSWMREYLIEQGRERILFVQSARLNEQPALIAKQIRHILDFDEGWAASYSTWTDALKALREAIEAAKILIVVNGIVGNNTHRKLDPSEFRGFVLVDDYAPLVFVNGADTKAAQMFTLAHELAHVFFGSSAAFDLREMSPANDPMEKACNSVAAEFLIPESQLRRIWPSVNNETEPFQAIARRFKISALVAARRALDLHLINRSDFLEFYRAYQQDERRTAASRPDGGDFYANQNLRVGQRFVSTVIRAVKEGKLLYTEAYKLTSLYGKAFEHYASHLGMGGV